jgi:hypothetical protein
MKIKNLRISWQLTLAFSIMMAFVTIIGLISTVQSERLNKQTELIYNHPLKVRKAIGELNNDISKMRLAFRDLMLAENNTEQKEAIEAIKLYEIDASRQFDILKSQYLGPKEDVEDAYNQFVLWNTIRAENIELALKGDISTIKKRLLTNGEVGKNRNLLFEKIQKIDNYALNKSISIYEYSNSLKNILQRRMLIFVLFILIISSIINYLIIRNIKKPVNELSCVSRKFQDGDYNIIAVKLRV